MRVAIIVDDNIVLVDGKARNVDTSSLIENDIHAVQWYGEFGEEEYRTYMDTTLKAWSRKPNAIINDFTPYDSYVDAWRIEDAKQNLIESEIQRQIAENLEAAKATQKRIQEELTKASTQESQTP